jgi:hypothetical protein
MCLLLIVAGCALGQTAQKIRVPAGQTADLWSGVIITGKVNLALQTRDGKNIMKLWWVKWGIGSTEEIGNWGPSGSLEIPISWWKGVVSAKLRGQALSDTMVCISDRAAFDKQFTFEW